MYFSGRQSRRIKWISILFRPAGRNSTRFLTVSIKKGGKAAFLYVLQQQPLSQPQPQLLPFPFQSTKMMTRTMIHHQLLPKAQIPEELLQDITKPPEI